MDPLDWKVRQIREVSGVEVVVIAEPGRPYPVAKLDGWFEIELRPVTDYDLFTGAHRISGYETDRLNVFSRWKVPPPAFIAGTIIGGGVWDAVMRVSGGPDVRE